MAGVSGGGDKGPMVVTEGSGGGRGSRKKTLQKQGVVKVAGGW